MLRRSKKPKVFNLITSVREIEKQTQELPENECFKYISDGGFSSISFVKFIAKKTIINEFMVTTLRVGKKELECLCRLKSQGRIGMIRFYVRTLMKNDSKKLKSYGYYDGLEKMCAKNGWTVEAIHNHSKILLFDTDQGKYVIETSSNLNENPKIEQFSFEKDEPLYDFYYKHFTTR